MDAAGLSLGFRGVLAGVVSDLVLAGVVSDFPLAGVLSLLLVLAGVVSAFVLAGVVSPLVLAGVVSAFLVALNFIFEFTCLPLFMAFTGFLEAVLALGAFGAFLATFFSFLIFLVTLAGAVYLTGVTDFATGDAGLAGGWDFPAFLPRAGFVSLVVGVGGGVGVF